MPHAPVAATRKAYYDPAGVLTLTRDPHLHRASVGRRDNVVGYTNGAVKAAGSVMTAMSAEEALELFNMGITGTPVITTPTGATITRLHTYKPGDLAAATIEYNDGALNWQGAGYKVNTLTIAGAVDGDSTITADLFGTNMLQVAATTGLTDRTPSFIEGWQARVFVDAFTGVPGTTVVSGFLTNWSVALGNNLDRVYTADNTLGANRVTSGLLDVSAKLTVDATSPQALSEFNNWAAGTMRMVRIEFSDETQFIEGAFRHKITVDVPGAWTAINLGASGNGVRKYEIDLQGVYSGVLAAMFQLQVQSSRSAAFV